MGQLGVLGHRGRTCACGHGCWESGERRNGSGGQGRLPGRGATLADGTQMGGDEGAGLLPTQVEARNGVARSADTRLVQQAGWEPPEGTSTS